MGWLRCADVADGDYAPLGRNERRITSESHDTSFEPKQITWWSIFTDMSVLVGFSVTVLSGVGIGFVGTFLPPLRSLKLNLGFLTGSIPSQSSIKLVCVVLTLMPCTWYGPLSEVNERFQMLVSRRQVLVPVGNEFLPPPPFLIGPAKPRR